MERGTLGNTVRTVLAFVGLGTAVVVAELWQTVSSSFPVSTVEAAILVSPVASVGLACAYFAVNG
ncbi:hypothetical protein [Halorarius litoreus]|uniref:hypothetical protein n=1 Tax=Halorarius litoreus TaxID=2962676 RepID=UPI0020CB6BB0|nr:hypothetical protein [Halorarius litoreus]